MIKQNTSVLGLALLATLMYEASAAIRPSFHLDFAAVKATHIVVATEGEVIDGILQVVESWKGDLRKDQIITVPELAQFASEQSRMIHRWDKKGTKPVTGARMILFLVKSLELPTHQDHVGRHDTSALRVRWLPAGDSGYRSVFAGGIDPRDTCARMKIAVAWVESDAVYAFQQIFNPGPVVLDKINSLTEDKVKARVLERAANCSEFEKAAALPDPIQRANALVSLTNTKQHRARERTFNCLAECGIPALSHLREMLKDETLADRHYLVVKALAKAGGIHVGPELTKLLEHELAFWKTQTPLLVATRWNDLPGELRLHHIKLEQAIKAIDWIRFAGASETVIAIRNYWQNEPRLNRLTGGPAHNAIKLHCDEYLKHISNKMVMDVSCRIIREIVEELEKLRGIYSELSDFTQDCISTDGLSLHYRKNIVDGIKGTVLGKSEACEIVVSFSPIIDRGISPVPWGNYTVKYLKLNWQVCSYPACFWIPAEVSERHTMRFGGRFIRAYNMQLCEMVNGMVLNRLRKLDELEKRW